MTRTRLAPALDAVCIVVFVLIGRDSHGIHQGVGWFLTVVWPLLLGWFAVALATHLYARGSGTWRALTITWLGGVVVASFPVRDGDQLMIVSDGGTLIRTPVNDIRIARRQTQGVTVFRVGDGEKVVSVARLGDLGGDDTGDAGAAPAGEGK